MCDQRRLETIRFRGVNGLSFQFLENQMRMLTRNLARGLALVLFVSIGSVNAQQGSYEITLPAEPPYYRVRYAGSQKEGELAFPVSFTIWVPPDVKTLRGVVVHQHGCGEGSCKSGQTGAFDLHWQALAKKHDCVLMSPMYEQPEKANCQLWCDPRNGSDRAFHKGLADLGELCGHPELANVPWALWGHSGGGHWAGGMMMLHPERTVAAWLRSGVPALTEVEGKPVPYSIPDAACGVPTMCNVGTKEGVTVKDGQFAGVWPGVEVFFRELRSKGGLVGVAVDPLSSHDCGNQRYLAIPWLDTCLATRLPERAGDPLRLVPAESGWLAPLYVGESKLIPPVPAGMFGGAIMDSVWLPNEASSRGWVEYVKDTAITDVTPPPSPANLQIKGNELSWTADADLESGLAGFLIERDGKLLVTLPERPKNPFGRPIFQNLQYSDTPTLPLVEMRYTDTTAEPGKNHRYRVIAINTAGLKSQ
jgi:poly(3-hydroxybutyrate) depolymerase